MKIKTLLLLISIVFSISNIQAQDFDSKLEKLAEDTASKITENSKKKIAVWGFFEANGKQTALGNYITEDFSVYITNYGDNFEIIDRNHLDLLLKEHKLNAEGFIDNDTAKEIGKITAADAIITGTYSMVGADKVKVRVKVLDTESALQFAANMGLLPLSDDLKDIANTSYDAGGTKTKGTTGNSSNCESDKGSLCFHNTTNEKMIVAVRYFKYADQKRGTKISKTIIIDAGKTKCVYELFNKETEYYIVKFKTFTDDLEGVEARIIPSMYMKYLEDKGEIMVEACAEKTFTIK
ncbi:FlgO family outer membrane protein [uncultured Winogradskyella sp.]|uniref:FlgO family outer membrane protein n=1 Tax=uncultured Winogradskyella sp. TaxID=395353 RepID=UPI0026213471|nr:FlgO family outer membrane protein [uncultured Winogradskyella sp.]